jgi:hypothetical protein
MSKAKQKNIIRGLSKANRIIKEKVLNKIISLNYIGNLGYCIFSCSIFWHPMGFD